MSGAFWVLIVAAWAFNLAGILSKHYICFAFSGAAGGLALGLALTGQVS